MTTQIIISDIIIHQDNEGRYSVNDLHKASGNEQRHQPRYWLSLQQTAELISEIVNSGITLFEPTHTQRGCRGGTYVCKELVYAYAMWVSAKFHLAVIRAYDALVTTPAPKTTIDERTPLRDAVNLLVSKRALPYDQAYSIIHQRFAVQSIEDLEPETLPAAIEYVHRLAIEGELLERQSPVPAMPIFPINADFEYITRVHNGVPEDIQIIPPGKMLLHPSDAVEMLRRTGMVIIHHKELSNYPAAQLAALCSAASKEEARWARVEF